MKNKPSDKNQTHCVMRPLFKKSFDSANSAYIDMMESECFITQFVSACRHASLLSLIFLSCRELADCVTYGRAAQRTALTWELGRVTWKYDAVEHTAGRHICQQSFEQSVCQRWPKDRHLHLCCTSVNCPDMQKQSISSVQFQVWWSIAVYLYIFFRDSWRLSKSPKDD